jgi:hypothetical protein
MFTTESDSESNSMIKKNCGKAWLRLSQFNLIDRLPFPPTPQKLASPTFFYFVQFTFFSKF